MPAVKRHDECPQAVSRQLIGQESTAPCSERPETSMITRWIRSVHCFLIVMAMGSPSYGQIQIAPNQETKAKANYLFNIAKFTTWPDDVLGPGVRFQLCVLGTDPFGLILDLIAIRGVRGHEVELVRLPSDDRAIGCHLLFLTMDAISENGAVPAELLRRGLLIVTDIAGLARRGATVNLASENGRPRLEINVGAARRAALILSSQLLRLGRLTTDAESGSR